MHASAQQTPAHHHRVRRLPLALSVSVALLVLIASTWFSLAYGSHATTSSQVLNALQHRSNSAVSEIVWGLRLPRTCLAIIVGASLAVSGVIIQGLTRNTFADPSIIGVSDGAALAVVTGIAVFHANTYGQYFTFGAIGAGASCVLVLLAMRYMSGYGPMALPLLGLAVAAACKAMTAALLVLVSSAYESYRFWSAGSLDTAQWGQIVPGAIVLSVCLPTCLYLASSLDRLALGQDLARSLGDRVAMVAALCVVLTAVMTGASVAAAGPIAFVGLIVPNALRLVLGPQSMRLVTMAAVTGATLLLLADTAGRIIGRPGEVQVGIVMALIGAPLFIALAATRRSTWL